MLLERARTALDAGKRDIAEATATALLAADPWEWRAVWIQGLAALERGDSRAAQAAFNAVYGQVPGELAPKLALAQASEQAGDGPVAENLYIACARTDATYVPMAAFGLARIRAGRADIDGAVAAYRLVPPQSSAYRTARAGLAELLARANRGLPDLAEALRTLDDTSMSARRRAELTTLIYREALVTVEKSGNKADVRLGAVEGYAPRHAPRSRGSPARAGPAHPRPVRARPPRRRGQRRPTLEPLVTDLPTTAHPPALPPPRPPPPAAPSARARRAVSPTPPRRASARRAARTSCRPPRSRRPPPSTPRPRPPRSGEESPLDVGWTGAVPSAAVPAGPAVVDEPACHACGQGHIVDGYCDHCGTPPPNPRDHFVESPADWVGGVCDIGRRHTRNEDAMALSAGAAPGSRAVLVVCDGVSMATDSHIASLAAAQAARVVLDQPLPAASAPRLLGGGRGPGPHDGGHDRQRGGGRLRRRRRAQPALVHPRGGRRRGRRRRHRHRGRQPRLLAARRHRGARRAARARRLVRAGADGGGRAAPRGRDRAARALDHALARRDAPDDLTPHLTTVTTTTTPGWLMVCSDGLWNYCSEAEALRDLLRRSAAGLGAAGADPTALAQALVDFANEQGGRDNITVALARLAGRGSSTTNEAAAGAAPVEGDKADG